MPDTNRAQLGRADQDAETSDIDRIKEKLSSQCQRERYRHLTRLVTTLRKKGALPVQGPLRFLVATGQLEGRPYDISALAAVLDLPRTTVFRHLDGMRQEGSVKLQPEGRRTLVLLTDLGWRQMSKNWDVLDPLIDEFIVNQMQHLRSPSG